jgi:DNA segregation ATPase FtsK/SpoIIIE-like protein
MKLEHKAIIAAANRDGKLPMEVAKELLAHDLLQSMVTSIGGHAVAFNKMSQQQQDAVIHDMQRDLTAAIDMGIRIIASQNTRTVRMKLKSVAIGKKWKIVGEAEGDEEFLHELADRTQDQSDVLVVLYERDYIQGLDAIQGEKDQKALPLDGDKSDKPAKAKRSGAKAAGDIAAQVAPKKEIELPPTLIDQAQEFVRNAQTATTAGIQNQFKCNFDKGEAILAALELRGIVTPADDKGNRDLVRPKPEVKADQATATKDVEQIHTPGSELSQAELYEQAKARVIANQEVSLGGLAVTFDLTDEQAGDLIDRLELEGVISEADDLGGREVFELPA